MLWGAFTASFFEMRAGAGSSGIAHCLGVSLVGLTRRQRCPPCVLQPGARTAATLAAEAQHHLTQTPRFACSRSNLQNLSVEAIEAARGQGHFESARAFQTSVLASCAPFVPSGVAS